MSDMVSGLTVVLDDPILEEDAERLKTAISLLQGVATVQAINTRISSDAIAVMSERCRVAQLLREMAFKLTTGR
jgi:hypothetical protein